MFLTQEDYRKIESWLKLNSKKDTDFGFADSIDGSETIVIVQGNKNKRIFLRDFINEVGTLFTKDLVNVSADFGLHGITLETAIQAIPLIDRKEGLVITFEDTDSNWRIYLFIGELTLWNLVDLWQDVLNWESFAVDSLLPDEEDITATEPDGKGNAKLKFADKEYNPDSFSGLGHVILRKNLVEVMDFETGKSRGIVNFLQPDMINKENTIYEIRYDFDLNGLTITIPKGGVLYFNGGKLNNGTIKGNNTNIQYSGTVFNNIDILGTWNVPIIHTKMFLEVKEINFLPKVFKLTNGGIHNSVIIDDGLYSIITDLPNPYSSVNSNTLVELLGAITINSNNKDGGLCLICSGSNIKITGSGKIIGDRDTNTSDTEWAPAIYCNNCKNLVIEGITIEKSYGDGIYCRYNCDDVIIRGVTFTKIRRCAIAFNSGKNHTITLCVFNENGGRAPGCAIEFESDGKDIDIPILNNFITNNSFIKNDRDIILGAGSTYTDTVIVKGNNSTGATVFISVAPKVGGNYDIRNIVVENNIVAENLIFANISSIHKYIISGNYITNASSDHTYPLLNLKGNGVLLNNTIVAPDKLIMDSTYQSLVSTKLDICGNNIEGYNMIGILENSYITGNVLKLLNINFEFTDSLFQGNTLINTKELGRFGYVRLHNSSMVNNKINHNNSSYKCISLKYLDKTSAFYDNVFNDGIDLSYTLEVSPDFEGAILGKYTVTPYLCNLSSRRDIASVGVSKFDTDLGKPIYWNGSDWVDANGETV